MASLLSSLIAILAILLICSSSIDAFYILSRSTVLNHAPRTSQHELYMSSNDNNIIPTQDEIAQQKSEAYTALSSFHETSTSLTTSDTQIKSLLQGLDTIGMTSDEKALPQAICWSCPDGAITYTATMDRQAGLKRGIISQPYKCSVQVEMDIGELSGRTKRRGLRLVESMSFDNGEQSSIPFVRDIPLNENVDVDGADGSYSLDTRLDATAATSDSPQLPLLPSKLLGGVQTQPSYVIEHTIAVSEMERYRCFLLYGNDDGIIAEGEDNDEDDVNEGKTKMDRKEKSMKTSDGIEKSYRLVGIILSEETKVMPEEEQNDNDKEEEADYASDFISQMIETPPEPSPSSPLDLLEIDQSEPAENDEGDKMAKLMQSIDKHNTRVMEENIGAGSGVAAAESNDEMRPTSVGMFGLTSGVWLGDTFVRETISPQLYQARKKKGFGKTTSNKVESEDEGEDRFAVWCQGVQKVAFQFCWDYHKIISQSYTYGRFMGVPTSLASMANIKSDGIVVVNEAQRTKKREEKRVIFDIDGGQMIGGLIGSTYFRCPRVMTFSSSKVYSADAYLSEFMVFYQPVKSNDDEKSRSKSLEALLDEDNVPEYYCSRTARLIANDGSLLQGSTAFFSLKQALTDQ